MRILKRIPKLLIIAIVLLIIGLIATNMIHHFTVKSRVDEQKNRIQQQQQFVEDKLDDLPKVPDIWDD
ncbi:MAG: hypothetical protein LBI03_02000 [Clostridiales bacterium]|jgi:Tfp pilus assembly protein PilE|nr:hypothetical protein [Clostridiales bacterium]